MMARNNIDGLSRDEVLLSSLVTTAVVVLLMRYLARRSHGGPRAVGAPSDVAGRLLVVTPQTR